jgi:hypothetical protein
MSYQQVQQGAGATAYNHTAPEVSSSLLTANSSPGTTTTPAPTLPGRQLAKTNPCTWPNCPRFFACPHNVQQHIREKHTHEKPYKCEDCVDVAFARQYGLNRHRAQVHGDEEKPSRVAAGRRTYGSAPSAEPEQTFVPFTESTQATTGADEMFAELMGLLGEENARKEVSGGDVEMSDNQFYFAPDQWETPAVGMPGAQFHFDAEQPEPAHNNAQHGSGELLGCGECDYFAATRNDMRMHMHVAHQVPNNPLCACNICTMLQCSSEIDAAHQLSMLVQGGFQKIREDENAGFLGEGADFATASTTTTSAWQPDLDNTADYTTAGTIDPSLLNLAGLGGFGRHEQ